MKEKLNSPFMIYTDLKVFSYQKIMKVKNLKSLIRADIKNMLLIVMTTN